MGAPGRSKFFPHAPPDPLIQVLGAQLSPRRLKEGFQGQFGWGFEPPKVIFGDVWLSSRDDLIEFWGDSFGYDFNVLA